jgi:hypothetical protein
MMQYDVKSAAVAASQTDAAIFAGPARIKGIALGIAAAGGTVALKNGSGGTTVFQFVAPASAGSAVYIAIPGEGIRCDSGIYATTPAGATATVFYG